MSSESHIAELTAEVTAAFDGVQREDGTTLHEAIAIDDRKSLEEQLAARRLDSEQRWQDVTEESILASSAAPHFLDAKGFRFYLPAFVVYGLNNWDNLTTSILDTCEWCLLQVPPSEPAAVAAQYGFTNAQSRAIAHFLRFHVESYADPTNDASTLKAVAEWEAFVGSLPS